MESDCRCVHLDLLRNQSDKAYRKKDPIFMTNSVLFVFDKLGQSQFLGILPDLKHLYFTDCVTFLMLYIFAQFYKPLFLLDYFMYYVYVVLICHFLVFSFLMSHSKSVLFNLIIFVEFFITYIIY